MKSDYRTEKSIQQVTNAELLVLAASSLATAQAGVNVLLSSGVGEGEAKDVLGACVYYEIDRARSFLDEVHGVLLRGRKKKKPTHPDDDEEDDAVKIEDFPL